MPLSTCIQLKGENETNIYLMKMFPIKTPIETKRYINPWFMPHDYFLQFHKVMLREQNINMIVKFDTQVVID